MNTIERIMSALDERKIASEVGLAHDETRMRYPLQSNTVGAFDEFTSIIGDYYNYHFSRCMSNGGRLSMTEYELFELLQGSYEKMNVDTTIYFTLVSAYLVVAFLVGSNLTRIQLFIINTLYILWTLGTINT